jgi:hypothetical protein
MYKLAALVGKAPALTTNTMQEQLDSSAGVLGTIARLPAVARTKAMLTSGEADLGAYVHVTRGEEWVRTTSDLGFRLQPGDSILIAGEQCQLHPLEAVYPTRFRLSQAYEGESGEWLPVSVPVMTLDKRAKRARRKAVHKAKVLGNRATGGRAFKGVGNQDIDEAAEQEGESATAGMMRSFGEGLQKAGGMLGKRNPLGKKLRRWGKDISRRHKAKVSELDVRLHKARYRLLRATVDELLETDTKKLLVKPVDAKKEKGYYGVVRKPVFLGPLRDSVKSYRDTTSFAADVRLSLKNTMAYFPKTSPLYPYAKKLEAPWQDILDNMDATWQSTMAKTQKEVRREEQSAAHAKNQAKAAAIRKQAAKARAGSVASDD